MDEKYFAKKIEAKWQQKWRESGAFNADVDDERPKFYQLEMLPYPSGNLHMGHVRNYSAGDALAWYKRLKGFNVLHPIGWDSFGQPAEDAAVKRKVNPREWTEKNIEIMQGQLQRLGVSYRSEHLVERIEHVGREFRVVTQGGEIRAGKVVLTAGNGNARLAPMVGLDVPVRPQRGQLIVTERIAPFLHYPITTIRQTDEGSVMLGDSQEEAGFDTTVATGVTSVLADRAIRMFPRLGALNIVRTWAALRVMTKDGFPIYEQSESCPGAFVATCHSGVTLAANHALTVAPCIARGELPAELFQTFSARRFHVPAAA